jgi:hypothetical protein
VNQLSTCLLAIPLGLESCRQQQQQLALLLALLLTPLLLLPPVRLHPVQPTAQRKLRQLLPSCTDSPECRGAETARGYRQQQVQQSTPASEHCIADSDTAADTAWLVASHSMDTTEAQTASGHIWW